MNVQGHRQTRADQSECSISISRRTYSVSLSRSQPKAQRFFSKNGRDRCSEMRKKDCVLAKQQKEAAGQKAEQINRPEPQDLFDKAVIQALERRSRTNLDPSIDYIGAQAGKDANECVTINNNNKGNRK